MNLHRGAFGRVMSSHSIQNFRAADVGVLWVADVLAHYKKDLSN
jgi:hypothetical protein